MNLFGVEIGKVFATGDGLQNIKYNFQDTDGNTFHVDSGEAIIRSLGLPTISSVSAGLTITIYSNGSIKEKGEQNVSHTTGWKAFELAGRNLNHIYIDGPPGIGKTYAAMQLADNKNKVVQVTLNEDLMVQELLGHYIPKGNVFVWHDGPVAHAIRGGGILVLNEIQRASSAVQDMFLGVLDNREVCKIALPTNEILTPSEDFKVIATSNSPIDVLDSALIDRFEAVISVRHPHPNLVKRLNEVFEGLGRVVEDSYKDIKRAVSPRKALTFAYLVNEKKLNQDDAVALAFGETRRADINSLIRLKTGVGSRKTKTISNK